MSRHPLEDLAPEQLEQLEGGIDGIPVPIAPLLPPPIVIWPVVHDPGPFPVNKQKQ